MRMELNEKVIEKIKQQIASRLLQAGHMLATGLKAQLSVSYPPASRPGQFPHGRTWAGRDAVAVSPTNPRQVVSNGMKVRIGYRKMTFDYMPFLELERNRKGLMYQFQVMKPMLRSLIEGKKAD